LPYPGICNVNNADGKSLFYARYWIRTIVPSGAKRYIWEELHRAGMERLMQGTSEAKYSASALTGETRTVYAALSGQL